MYSPRPHWRGIQEEDAPRNGNKRAASTIIMLCAIAVAAVVLVHKESSVPDEHTVGGQVLGEDMDLMLFQDDAKDAPKEAKTHRHHRQRLYDPDLSDGEVIRLAADTKDAPAANTTSELPVPPVSPTDDPDLPDTLAPVHASLRTGHVENYGQNAYDANVVAAAGAVAAHELKEGKPQEQAYVKAQDVATDHVVSGAATNSEAPAFSRTIRAAAYAAEMKALKELEAGSTSQVAKNAAQEAARDLVQDERSVQMTVPVPSTLSELLSNVDHLWGKMKGNLLALTATMKGISTEDCDEVKQTAAASAREMQMALLAASEHIQKGRQHKTAMDTALLEVEVHEDRARSLMESPDTVLVQSQVEVIDSLASDSKQKSAVHHLHAKRQAHLAEGFLALAAKHHEAATDAATKCKAAHMLEKFGYAEQQLTAFEAQSKQRSLERAQKREEERQLAATRKENAALVSAMEASLAEQMAVQAKDAAAKALKLGRHTVKDKLEVDVAAAKQAAEEACSAAMHSVAKSLAANMASVAAKNGWDTKGAMKKAILTVLKVGRPMEGAVVAKAVEEATNEEVAARKAAGPAYPAGEGALPVAGHSPKVTAAPAIKQSMPPKEAPAAKAAAQAQKSEAAPQTKQLQPVSNKIDVQKKAVSEAKAEPASQKDEVKVRMGQELQADKNAKSIKAAKAAAIKAKTQQIEQDVKTKDAKESTHKKLEKAASVKKAVAAKAQKEKAHKKSVKKGDAKPASPKEKEEAKAKTKTQEDGHKEWKKGATKKAAKQVLTSAKKAVTKAVHSADVQSATLAMSDAVTKAAAEAAEIARLQVAKAGGSMEEQLKAASVAAKLAAEQASKSEALKLKDVVKATAQDDVVASTKSSATKQAKAIANVDGPPKDIAVDTKTDSKPKPSPKAEPKKKAKAEEKTEAKEETLMIERPMVQEGASRMQLSLEAAARSELKVLLENGAAEETLEEKMNSAMGGAINKEITKASSIAAATAARAAQAQGMSADIVQQVVAQSAQKAAQQAKNHAVQLSKLAVKNALKKAAH